MNEYQNQNQDYRQPQYDDRYHQPGFERVVTIGEWLRLILVSLFSLIPFIGWIIAIVIYIVKATNPELPASYRNLIKAGFIWAGICLGLTILLCIMAFSMFSYNLTGGTIQDILKGLQ